MLRMYRPPWQPWQCPGMGTLCRHVSAARRPCMAGPTVSWILVMVHQRRLQRLLEAEDAARQQKAGGSVGGPRCCWAHQTEHNKAQAKHLVQHHRREHAHEGAVSAVRTPYDHSPLATRTVAPTAVAPTAVAPPPYSNGLYDGIQYDRSDCG